MGSEFAVRIWVHVVLNQIFVPACTETPFIKLVGVSTHTFLKGCSYRKDLKWEKDGKFGYSTENLLWTMYP